MFCTSITRASLLFFGFRCRVVVTWLICVYVALWRSGLGAGLVIYSSRIRPRSPRFWVQPWASCSHTCASVIRQYNLVLVEAGKVTQPWVWRRTGHSVVYPPAGSTFHWKDLSDLWWGGWLAHSPEVAVWPDFATMDCVTVTMLHAQTATPHRHQPPRCIATKISS